MTEILTESFCERCGTRYTFETARPRNSRIGRAKTFSKGLRNYVLSDDSFSEAMADARGQDEMQATVLQLDAFHKTFNFCFDCRQYTCGNCWNNEDGRCLSCAPVAGSAPLEALEPSVSDAIASRLAAIVAPPTEPAAQTSSIGVSAWPSVDLPSAPPPPVKPPADQMAEVEAAALAEAAASAPAEAEPVSTPEPELIAEPRALVVVPEPAAEPVVAHESELVAEPEVVAAPDLVAEPDVDAEPITALVVVPELGADWEPIVAPDQEALVAPEPELIAEPEAISALAPEPVTQIAEVEALVDSEAELEAPAGLEAEPITAPVAHALVTAPEAVVAPEPLVAAMPELVAEPWSGVPSEPLVAPEPEPLTALVNEPEADDWEADALAPEADVNAAAAVELAPDEPGTAFGADAKASPSTDELEVEAGVPAEATAEPTPSVASHPALLGLQPGQSLDDAIAAYEASLLLAEAVPAPEAVAESDIAAELSLVGESGPDVDVPSVVWETQTTDEIVAGPEAAAEVVAETAPIAEPEAIAEDVAHQFPDILDAAEAVAGPDVDGEPIASPAVEEVTEVLAAAEPEAIAEPGAIAEAAIEPEAIAEPEPEAVEPAPEAVAEPEPVIAPEPEPVAVVGSPVSIAPVAPVAAPEPAPIAATAAPAQPVAAAPAPGWLTVAPDDDSTPVAASRPAWPTSNRPPLAGATLAGRAMMLDDNAADLWAASAREVLQGGPQAGSAPGAGPASVPMARPCVGCGLSLSASARFCRRCGTRQS